MRSSQNNSEFGVITMTVISFLAIAMSVGVTACSPAKWHETVTQPNSPFTGDPIAERQTTGKTPQDFKPGQTATVRSDRLCGRRIPTDDCSKSKTILEKGDKVEVVDPTPQGPDKVVKVKVTRTVRPDLSSEPVYVPPQFLTQEPLAPEKNELSADRYFVVQNIASEKLRVYERCETPGCSHKLVLETDMVVGQNKAGRRSILGSFRITKWFKFYEDKQGEYPSWYSPAYPAIPTVGAPLKDWASKSRLPDHGSVRGAYGWYTAHLAPNSEEQWMHGTWGWGADQDRFVQLIRTSPFDKNDRLSSHGCTRVENQAIALMREILVPGTKVIKIYAREAYGAPIAEQPEGKLSGQWDWILTSEGVNSEKAPRSGRTTVEGRGVAKDKILESGRYQFSVKPEAKSLSKDANPHENGNAYGISPSSMHGYFLVDEGRVINYRHPRELEVGGHEDHQLPAVILGGKILEPQKSKKEILKPHDKADDGESASGAVVNEKAGAPSENSSH